MINNELYSLIRPFFVTRGWWTLSNNEMLDQYINIASQDVWNYYDWSFKIKTEDLTSVENWDYLKWETTYNIDTIVDIEDEYGNKITPMTKKISADNECNVWENFILTTTEVKEINIRYMKSYEWIKLAVNWTDSLQFPNKFVPALMNKIFDYASPLSYFEDDNAVPRYQIAVRQLDELKRLDWVSADIYFSPDNWI